MYPRYRSGFSPFGRHQPHNANGRHTAFADVRACDLKNPTPIGLVSSCTRNANGNDWNAVNAYNSMNRTYSTTVNTTDVKGLTATSCTFTASW